MNEEARKLIATYHVGGIILYKPNVKDTKQLVGLVNDLKKTNSGNKLPLWLGVDEEGGRVTRLPDEILKTPTSQTIGKSGKTQVAHNIGQLLGKELNAYGLNMDFAPDLDINSNPKNPVIGDRSFGANATLVSSFRYSYDEWLARDEGRSGCEAFSRTWRYICRFTYWPAYCSK